MRSYSTIKAILTSRFTCFRDIRTIWGEQAHITQFLILVTQQNIQSLQLDILHQMRPYSSVEAIRGLVDFHLFSVFGEIGPIQGPNYPILGSGGTTSYSKSPDSYFTSNEALPKFKGHLRVEFYIFQSIWAIRENWVQIQPKPFNF